MARVCCVMRGGPAETVLRGTFSGVTAVQPSAEVNGRSDSGTWLFGAVRHLAAVRSAISRPRGEIELIYMP
ncbi:hypothetical protein ACGFW5_20305 [Streptomyces sp. NPDC048416]|uniref:hypothetical protein n=1 Tax=Streptomyces sp. NPDC048416 TaxID=3365546 RepID=UPI0037141784